MSDDDLDDAEIYDTDYESEEPDELDKFEAKLEKRARLIRILRPILLIVPISMFLFLIFMIGYDFGQAAKVKELSARESIKSVTELKDTLTRYTDQVGNSFIADCIHSNTSATCRTPKEYTLYQCYELDKGRVKY